MDSNTTKEDPPRVLWSASVDFNKKQESAVAHGAKNPQNDAPMTGKSSTMTPSTNKPVTLLHNLNVNKSVNAYGPSVAVGSALSQHADDDNAAPKNDHFHDVPPLSSGALDSKTPAKLTNEEFPIYVTTPELEKNGFAITTILTNHTANASLSDVTTRETPSPNDGFFMSTNTKDNDEDGGDNDDFSPQHNDEGTNKPTNKISTARKKRTQKKLTAKPKKKTSIPEAPCMRKIVSDDDKNAPENHGFAKGMQWEELDHDTRPVEEPKRDKSMYAPTEKEGNGTAKKNFSAAFTRESFKATRIVVHMNGWRLCFQHTSTNRIQVVRLLKFGQHGQINKPCCPMQVSLHRRIQTIIHSAFLN